MLIFKVWGIILFLFFFSRCFNKFVHDWILSWPVFAFDQMTNNRDLLTYPWPKLVNVAWQDDNKGSRGSDCHLFPANSRFAFFQLYSSHSYLLTYLLSCILFFSHKFKYGKSRRSRLLNSNPTPWELFQFLFSINFSSLSNFIFVTLACLNIDLNNPTNSWWIERNIRGWAQWNECER